MKIVLSGLILAAAAGVANAQFPFSTGFEAPDYAPGALNGQQTWVEINGGTGALTTNFSVVNGAGAFAGTQYVSTNTGTWGAFASNTSRYAWVDNTTNASPVDATVMCYVSSPSGTLLSGGGIFCFANAGANLVGGMRLLSTGVLQLYNGAGAGIQFGAQTALLNVYNEYHMNMDMTTGTINYYFNGQYLNPLLGTFATTFATGLQFSDCDLYAVRGTSGTGGSEVRWDNMSVTPAPGSLALLGLGGLVAGRRRR
jgi:MYXO-CTERM domain-containing protein